MEILDYATKQCKNLRMGGNDCAFFLVPLLQKLHGLKPIRTGLPSSKMTVGVSHHPVCKLFDLIAAAETDLHVNRISKLKYNFTEDSFLSILYTQITGNSDVG